MIEMLGWSSKRHVGRSIYSNLSLSRFWRWRWMFCIQWCSSTFLWWTRLVGTKAWRNGHGDGVMERVVATLLSELDSGSSNCRAVSIRTQQKVTFHQASLSFEPQTAPIFSTSLFCAQGVLIASSTWVLHKQSMSSNTSCPNSQI
jgi:hypothetical protein